jgi:hypothetical protein
MAKISLLFILLYFYPLFAKPPEWIADPPQGYLNKYMIGTGHSLTNGGQAYTNALENAVRKIAESRGIHVEPSNFKFERNDTQVRIHTSISFTTNNVDLDRFQIVEEYRQESPGNGIDVYVLIGYPNPSPRGTPSGTTTAIQSLLAPGWGHRTLGENRVGSLFLALSGIVLTGAITSYLTANQYHQQALEARTSRTIGYYNSRSHLFRQLSIGLSLSYGVCGAYSALHLAGSKYRNLYL